MSLWSISYISGPLKIGWDYTFGTYSFHTREEAVNKGKELAEEYFDNQDFYDKKEHNKAKKDLKKWDSINIKSGEYEKIYLHPAESYDDNTVELILKREKVPKKSSNKVGKVSQRHKRVYVVEHVDVDNTDGESYTDVQVFDNKEAASEYLKEYIKEYIKEHEYTRKKHQAYRKSLNERLAQFEAERLSRSDGVYIDLVFDEEEYAEEANTYIKVYRRRVVL